MLSRRAGINFLHYIFVVIRKGIFDGRKGKKIFPPEKIRKKELFF